MLPSLSSPSHGQQAHEEAAEDHLIAEHGECDARHDHAHRLGVVETSKVANAPDVEHGEQHDGTDERCGNAEEQSTFERQQP